MRLGWIETSEMPTQKGDSTKPLWQWLATSEKSNHLEFVKDCIYVF